MLYVQTQHERRKATLVMVMLVLFLLQSVVAGAELGTPDLNSPDNIDCLCAANCIDSNFGDSGLNNPLAGAEDDAHCDDCSGCQLTAMLYNLNIHPVPESRFRFAYFALLVKTRPTKIDRPPIA